MKAAGFGYFLFLHEGCDGEVGEEQRRLRQQQQHPRHMEQGKTVIYT